MIEFPDMQALQSWYNSPEYQPLIGLRKQCTSEMDMLFFLRRRMRFAARRGVRVGV